MFKYRVTCYIKGSEEDLKKRDGIFEFLLDLPFHTNRSRETLKEFFNSYPEDTVLKDFLIDSKMDIDIKKIMASIQEEHPEVTLASWDHV